MSAKTRRRLENSENIPMNEQSEGTYNGHLRVLKKSSLENSDTSVTSMASHECLCEEFIKLAEGEEYSKGSPEENSQPTMQDEGTDKRCHYFESVERSTSMYEEAKVSEETVSVPTEEIEETEEDSDSMKSECYNYGEPTKFQHLVYDFTPVKGVDDNDEVIQKCVDFWNFVYDTPELQDMIALPIRKVNYKKLFQEDKIKDTNIEKATPRQEVKSAMQWTAELPLNYLGKLSIKYCREPSPCYKLASDITEEGSTDTASNTSRFWSLSKIKKEASSESSNKHTVTPRANKAIKKLNADMEEFDQKHPRSFDSPILRQDLILSDMQRLPSGSHRPPLID